MRFPGCCSIAGSVISGLLVYFHDIPPTYAKEAAVAVCNFAPYSIRVSLLEADIDGIPQNHSVSPIKAGSCEALAGSTDPLSTLYVYAEAENSEEIRRLKTFDLWGQAWPDFPSWGGGADGKPACVSSSKIIWTGFSEEAQSCPAGEKKVVFHDALSLRDEEGAYWNVVDYGVCNILQSFDCDNTPIDVLLAWAGSLAKALRNGHLESKPDSPWEANVHPTATGLRLMDHNGPFDLGVRVNSAISVTPLGSPVQIRPNDVLLELNGHDIYHHDEVIYYFYKHAIESGVDAPYTATVQRENQVLRVQGFMYFDDNLAGRMFLDETGQCRLTTAAAILGALEEFSFYTLRYINCSVEKSVSEYRYESCVRNRTLFLAAYKQFCPNETLVGTVLGGMWFPARGAAERFLFGGPVKATGSNLLRALILEGSEEAARSALTLPSGYSGSESFDTILNDASIGATLGGAFQLALPNGFKGAYRK